MKAKEFFYLLGMRPTARRYGSEVVRFELAREGMVEFAQWQHPRYPKQVVRQEQVGMLRRFLTPGDVAIDIGAHTGDSTVPMALAVGPKGKVFALEPNGYVYPTLEQNAGLNGGKVRIVPLNFAATPEDGEMEFEYSDSGFCNGGRHEAIANWKHAHAFKLKVQGRNLPAYLKGNFPDEMERVAYIKVDAEGYDFTILKSLEGLLRRNRPYVKAEVFRHTTVQQRFGFLQFLREMEYKVYRVAGEADYMGPPLTGENLVEKEHYDIFCVPEGKGLR